MKRAVCKIFGVRTVECVEHIRQCVGLYDVAEIVECRRMRFVDSWIHCGRYVDLFLSFRHC